MSLSVGSLGCFHTYLSFTNQTTYENVSLFISILICKFKKINRVYNKTGNPFSKGLLSNLKETLFYKVPFSQVALNKKYSIAQIDAMQPNELVGEPSHSVLELQMEAETSHEIISSENTSLESSYPYYSRQEVV